MKLIMKVSSRNEYDEGGCVLASIHLTQDLAELALRRIDGLCALQNQDPRADEIYYWNYDAEFFDPFLEPGGNPQGASVAPDTQLFEQFEMASGDFIEVDAAFQVPETQLARVECTQMIARKEGIAFVAIPKHASFYVETTEIPLEVLRRAATHQ
ncbi:MAG TPA: hypothetical protein VMH03_17135 [Terriglobales bacterium]|nr:hypothetical protein [Terriglobales bacterium]